MARVAHQVARAQQLCAATLGTLCGQIQAQRLSVDKERHSEPANASADVVLALLLLTLTQRYDFEITHWIHNYHNLIQGTRTT